MNHTRMCRLRLYEVVGVVGGVPAAHPDATAERRPEEHDGTDVPGSLAAHSVARQGYLEHLSS